MAEAAPGDPLDALRERIRATQEAAEALAREAAAAAEAERERAEREGRVPPRGWQAPNDGTPGANEIAALAAIAESLRGMVPRDLERGLVELLRQLLLVLQSLIEFWLHRLDRRQRRDEVTVEDIPIS
jgi:hypothetical protein